MEEEMRLAEEELAAGNAEAALARMARLGLTDESESPAGEAAPPPQKKKEQKEEEASPRGCPVDACQSCGAGHG